MKKFYMIFVILIIGTSINCQAQQQQQQQADQSIQLTTKMPAQGINIVACPFRRCCPRFRQCPRDCPFCPFRQMQMQT